MRSLLFASLTLAGWTAGGLAAQGGSGLSQTGVIFPERPVVGDAPAIPAPPRVLGEEATPHDHRKGLPAIPAGTGTLPQPVGPESGGYDILHPPEVPCDLRFNVNEVVKPTGTSTSQVGEPSIAQVRDTCLQTGNWYAARSIDSGATWTYISPSTTFAASDGGFCCDQRAIYIPSADITVWLLQYSYSSTTQKAGQRIAIANGRADLQADTNGSWHSYYFTPQNFGRGAGEWMDFPDIAYSNGYLYVASNMFNAASFFTDAVVWRMPLSELAAGGSVSFNYSRSATGLSGGFSYRLTQNAGATMYFASHLTSTSVRAYRWVDGSGTINWTDVTVPAWTDTGFVATAPNGINWGGRSDGRITGAYYKSGEYGFLWGCAPRSGRAQVYVRAIRIATATNTLIAAEDTYSSTYQFLYPAVAVNSSGELGCCVAMANQGTGLHPTTGYFMVDACEPSFAGQSLAWFAGNSSPTSSSRWGDYFSVQRHSHYPSTFVATGMTCRNGGTNADSEPHFVWFCREADLPAPVSVAVSSTPVTGIPITVNVTDRSNLKNGNTNFTRTYNPRQGYVMTAPATFVSGATTYQFDRWVLNSAGQAIDDRVLTVDDIGGVDDTAEARYLAQRTLAVRSSNPTTGIAITVSARDLNGNQNGTTAFDRVYKHGVTVTVTAPAANGVHPFKQWIQGRIAHPIGQVALNVAMDSNETVTAVYYTHVAGTYTAFCSGCPGTASRIPSHTGTGTPEIGNILGWRITNAAANAGGTLYLGASRTLYNGFPLPLNLGFLGMGPSCLLCVSVDVSLAFSTNASGVAQVSTVVPTSTALINSHLYTQGAVVDFGAGTSIPIVHSNALDTRIGGNF